MPVVSLPVVNKQVLGNLVYVQYYVTHDTTKPRPAAFSLDVVLRTLGADYGHTGVQQISSGKAITLNSNAPGLPSINGRIDDWRGLKADGSIDTSADWSASTHVAFKVTGLATVSIPVGHFPIGRVPVDIGHSDLLFPC